MMFLTFMKLSQNCPQCKGFYMEHIWSRSQKNWNNKIFYKGSRVNKIKIYYLRKSKCKKEIKLCRKICKTILILINHRSIWSIEHNIIYLIHNRP